MIVKIIKKVRTYFFTKICKKFTMQYGDNLHINHWCTFTAKTSRGNNCHFNGMKITGNGSVIIGNNFHSGSGILILTSNHNYEGNAIPYDDTMIDGDVIIEDNVWLGQNVTILQGVKIGEGAIVQAGSVVVSNIEPYAIAGGHPAKVFKKRNVTHYEKLKKEMKYF